MRIFVKKEKALLSQFVKKYNEGKFEDLQVAKVLRYTIPFFAISWAIKPKNVFTIYVKKTEGQTDWSSVQKTFLEISDFVYLLKELQEIGFIEFFEMSNLNASNNDCMIMDRDKIAFDKDLNSFIVADHSNSNIKALIRTDYSSYYLDIADILDELSNKIIFPRPSLREYVEYGFQTEEQVYNKKQLRISRMSIIIACIALICSAAPYIEKLIHIIFKC